MIQQESWQTVVGVLALPGQVAEFCSQEVPAGAVCSSNLWIHW